MRTSLNEIREIEHFLSGDLSISEKLIFDAKRLIDNGLDEKVRAQSKAYRLIRAYGRNQLKAELSEVDQELFHKAEHSDFRKLVWRIFKR